MEYVSGRIVNEILKEKNCIDLNYIGKIQKSKIPSPIGNLILSPIQPLMQLSLLKTAAAGVTAEEIESAIRERNPHITKDLVGKLRTTSSPSTTIGLASAIFAQNNLKYAFSIDVVDIMI